MIVNGNTYLFNGHPVVAIAEPTAKDKELNPNTDRYQWVNVSDRTYKEMQVEVSKLKPVK